MRPQDKSMLSDLLFVVLLTCISAALVTLLGCATPRLEVTATSVTESGAQLLWGERHYAVATPQGAAEVNVSKRTLGVAAGAVAGGVIGAASGNAAMGMLVGTVAGGIGQALNRDAATSGTLPLTSPAAMATILQAGNQAEAAKLATREAIAASKASTVAEKAQSTATSPAQAPAAK